MIPILPENFRDLGGLTGLDGRIVAPKRLLRCGQPVGLSPADRAILRDHYNLRLIIDLRSRYECEKTPIDSFDGVRYHLVDLLCDLPDHTPGKMSHNGQPFTVDVVKEHMLSVYEVLVRNETARAGLHRSLTLLAEPNEGAALFHCFAGKDRTGLLAAILLTLLGVSKHDIFEDYLRTNLLRKQANQKMLDAAKADGASPEVLEAMLLAFSVDESFLSHAYATAVELFGSFDQFIREGIGVDDALTDTLRIRFLQ